MPRKGDKRPLAERFWEKVRVAGEDDCWEWQASTANGYGQIGADEYGMQRAHRVSYCLARGLVISQIRGVVVRHTCDNPICMNPKHLVLGTQLDNMRDKAERGRARGVKNPAAKLDGEQVAWIKTRIANGETLTSIALDYPVHVTTLGCIKRGLTWNEVSKTPETREKTTQKLEDLSSPQSEQVGW